MSDSRVTKYFAEEFSLGQCDTRKCVVSIHAWNGNYIGRVELYMPVQWLQNPGQEDGLYYLDTAVHDWIGKWTWKLVEVKGSDE